MAPPALFSRPPAPSRPGPKRVPVSEKHRKIRDTPIKRPRRRPTNKKKIEVLSFLDTSREFDRGEGIMETRKPTTREAGAFYGVHSSQVTRWRQQELQLLASLLLSRNVQHVKQGKWPIMEECLYNEFMEHRQKGKIIRQGWFRLVSTRLHAEHYPVQNFLSRYRIAIRFITNKAQKIPTDYIAVILRWLRFNRRNSDGVQAVDTANMDQTPAPFEYLDGRTYNAKGDKTIWAKAEKSGWDKRQATVQLTVLGDGTMLTPWIYLKGEGNVTEEEKQRYDKRVEVRFNPKAYANEGTILEWIEGQLAPQFDGRRALVALDAAAFHRTPAVLDLLAPRFRMHKGREPPRS